VLLSGRFVCYSDVYMKRAAFAKLHRLLVQMPRIASHAFAVCVSRLCRWMGNNRDLCVALSSILVSAVLIAVTVANGVWQRTHDTLTVLPILEYEVHTASSEFDPKPAGIYLRNCGLGTAVLKALGIEHAGREFSSTSQFEQFVVGEWEACFPDREALHCQVYVVPLNVELRGQYLEAGGTIPLLTIDRNFDDSETASFLRRLFAKLRLKAAWENLYGDSNSITASTRIKVAPDEEESLCPSD